MRSLEPHCPVHEGERLGCLVVLVEQVQPSLYPLERRAATGNHLLGGILEGRQSFGGISDSFFFPVDPVLVGFDQRPEFRAVLLRIGLGHELHVEDHALQLGEGRIDLGVFGPGRRCLRNLLARHDLGAHPHRMVRIGRPIDLHADAMPHGELDMPTIKHRQQIVLGLHSRVRAADFEDGGGVAVAFMLLAAGPDHMAKRRFFCPDIARLS